MHLTDIALELNRPDSARSYFDEQACLSERLKKEGIGHALQEAQVHYLTGRAHLLSGNGKEAYSSLEQAVREYKDLDREEELASVLLAFGDAALVRERREEARGIYEEARGRNPDMCNRRGIQAAELRLGYFFK